MANVIIVLILVAAVGYGIYSFIHHLRTAAAAAVSMTPPLKRSGRRTPTRATIRTASSWAWTA